MSPEVEAAAVGGAIAIIAGLVAPLLERIGRSKSIRKVARAELSSMRRNSDKFSKREITQEELCTTKPLLLSLVSELGRLTAEQAVAYRKAVVLFNALQVTFRQDRAEEVVQACDEALAQF